MFYFTSILNAQIQKNTQNICPPEIPQQLLLKSFPLKEFLYTAAHFVHSPYLEPSLTWPEDVPSPLHDCGAGGAVDKPKSGLVPQTCCSALRKSEIACRGCWLAKWLQNYIKAKIGQSSDLLLFASYPFIHEISRRESMRRIGLLQRQPWVWWSNDTQCSVARANFAGSGYNACVVNALADKNTITFDNQ